MDIFFYPGINNNLIKAVDEKVKTGFLTSVLDVERWNPEAKKDIGDLVGGYFELCSENLAVSYFECNLRQPLTLNLERKNKDNIYIFQFNLSKTANYFRVQGLGDLILCKNGINSCLVSNTSRQLAYIQEPGHSFQYLQICISKSYLQDIFKRIYRSGPADSHVIPLGEDNVHLYDLFLEDLILVECIIKTCQNSGFSSKTNLLLITYDVELLISNLLVGMISVDKFRGKENINPNELKSIEWIKEVIGSQLSQKYSLQQAASLINMSSSKFKRIFKKSTGLTYTEYYQKIRMEYSMCKISNSPPNSITEIAFEIGYNSLSQFTKAFKNYYGTPPSLVNTGIKKTYRAGQEVNFMN
jgi:AraC-like DNA-binding protein